MLIAGAGVMPRMSSVWATSIRGIRWVSMIPIEMMIEMKMMVKNDEDG